MKTAKTYSTRPVDVDSRWHVFDATDVVLGRLATEISTLLQGKHKPIYARHILTGDYVVVVNASRVKVTGAKLDQKMYRRHSHYPGALKETPLSKVLDNHPDRVIREAVWGMLPKTTLGRKMLRRLKVYAGDTHPHGAQVKDMAAEEIVVAPVERPARRSRAAAEAVAEPVAEVTEEVVAATVDETEAAEAAEEPAAEAAEEAPVAEVAEELVAEEPPAAEVTEEPVAEAAEEAPIAEVTEEPVAEEVAEEPAAEVAEEAPAAEASDEPVAEAAEEPTTAEVTDESVAESEEAPAAESTEEPVAESEAGEEKK